MKERNIGMHALAMRYFEGEITPSEEQVLFRFTQESEANSRQFAVWRTQWESEATGNELSLAGWARLNARMHMREGDLCTARRGFVRRGWRAVAAVALVALTVAGVRVYDCATAGEEAEFYTITTSQNDRSTINLPDGTQVRLAGGSTLTYPSDFNATNRQVALSGSAYFDVAPDEKNLFEVRVGECAVVVKGTKFDLSAYPDTSTITTTLLEGAVDFAAPKGVTALEPGRSLTYNHVAETSSITEIDAEQYLAWIEGRVEFTDVTVAQLCESLSSLYGVKIALDERLKGDRTLVTIHLSNQEPLDSVLRALDLIVPVSVLRHGTSLTLARR